MHRGVALALSAYVLWGLSPIFWRHGQGTAFDILTFRIVTTFVLLVVLQGLRDRGRSVRVVLAVPGVKRAMALSSLLLAANWLAFIWAVNNERVLDAGLGYFLNPLGSVLLGVTVLGERLRSGQWTAVAIAAVGVVWLSIDLGNPPWIPLILASTFALYGLLRKTAPVESLDGLTIEAGLMMPITVVALIAVTATGDGLGSVVGVTGWLWVLGTGAMTATPLLFFARAAREIPLWLVGVLQYISPTLTFLLGVLAYDEPWSGGQVVGYVIIWVGLVVFAAEGAMAARRQRVGTRAG